MAFDMEKTLDDMIDAIAGVVAGEWPRIKTCVEQALRTEKEALEAIAEARLSGEIDDAELESQLEDEKDALQAALLVCQIRTKVMAQKAANAATEVLTTAIEAALKIL